jgi:hypothetical protein
MSALPVNADILTYASEVDDLPEQVRSSIRLKHRCAGSLPNRLGRL